LFFSIPARPHTAKVPINFLALNEMKKADLEPSDLLLFGYVKRDLTGFRADNLSELLISI
jgi:hypothetical protein